MTLWLLLWVMAQPGECNDRSPGLSKCVEYRTTRGGCTCKAACYVRKAGSGDDGGTDARIVYGAGKDEPTCKADLERQASNGCRP